MSTSGRKKLLCEQLIPGLTGIDFVWVNPDDHRELAVFFVVEPNALVVPVNLALEEFTPTITGIEDGSNIVVSSIAWLNRIDATGATRLSLTLLVDEEGNFQNYTLSLQDVPNIPGPSRLDRFCAEIIFSFKQPCPSPFDCKQETDCPPLDLNDYPINYLARDFESFRNALMDFASDRYPNWEAQVPADQGSMIAELFAALGDEFSYIQDRFLREGWLETLTQRRSFNQLARLVDYRLDPGIAATGVIVARLYNSDIRPVATPANLIAIPDGVRVWAEQEDQASLPFEVGERLSEMITGNLRPLHTHWTDLPAYVQDEDHPCLLMGAQEIYLDDNGLLLAPHPVPVAQISQYWVGREVLIETRPDDPQAPVRRVIVQLDEPVESFNDPLTGAGPLLRLHWREEDALTFELDQSTAFVSANLLPVRAGMSVSENFLIGDSSDSTLSDIPRTVQRGGPRVMHSAVRPAIHRYTMSETVTQGLGWREQIDAAGERFYFPDAVVQELGAGGVTIADWTVTNDALDLQSTDEAISVEPGEWNVIARFERNGLKIVHHDYASNNGYTLRFGDGVFGRIPPLEQVFRVIYRTGPGTSANVPADTIRSLTTPPNSPATLQTMPVEVLSVRNPMAISNGRNPLDLETGKRIAPAAYKSILYRAVRDEDYRSQTERLEWVQQAGAVTRWTGAWASTFVTADPKGAFEISTERMTELQALMGAVRQTGRCVISKQPVYLPLDLKIAICIKKEFVFGDVMQRVLQALAPSAGQRAFFHPDNFSFGGPLSRPSLEAAIACVEGVTAVLQIYYRLRGVTDYVIFDQSKITVSDNTIIKVENDPTRPGQGSIRIYKSEIPAAEVA